VAHRRRRRDLFVGPDVLDLAGSRIGIADISGLPLLHIGDPPAILIDSGGPVLYREKCVGYRERVFTMVRFRAMVPDADAMLDDLCNRNCRSCSTSYGATWS
jgi:lipopolysaccharide/colanic/teichoic acid biosynthesis glycosyltransferase